MAENPITLSQALEGYHIAAHARRLAPGTLGDYDSAFRKLERFLGPECPMDSISATDILAFQSSLSGARLVSIR